MSVLRRNIASLFLWQLASYVLPLLTFPYLTRVIGPAGFGTLGYALAIIAYGALLTDWGFALSASQEVARHQNDSEHISKIFWNTMLAKLLLALTTLLLLLLAIFLLPSLSEMAPVLLAAWGTVLGSVLTLTWLLQGLECMERFVAAALLGRIVTIPLVFLLVHKPDDVWLAALIQSLGALVSGGVSIWLVARLRIIRWVKPSLAGAREQLLRGWEVFLGTAAVSLYTVSNTVVLGALAGTREVGFFTSADKLKTAAQGLVSPISQAVYPRANALFARSHKEAFVFLRKVLLLQGGFCLAISLGLWLTADWAVPLVLGPGYEEAVDILRWLSPLPFLVGLSNVFGIQVLLGLGLRQAFSRILMLAGGLNMILVFPLAYFWGAKGVAITMVAVELFVTGVMAGFIVVKGIPLFRRRS